MLLLAVFMLALLVLSLSVAIPEIIKEIQRDREVETMHRGLQYRRAIQLYYRKFNAYPPSIDALVKTNNIRFLRKKYIDPMTGKNDWKPIALGQNKAPLAMGFFGQPLTGAGGGATPMAGIGPSGGNGMNGTGSTFGGSGFGGSNTGGSSGTLGSIFGSNNSGSTFGAGSNANSAAGTTGTSTGSTDSSGNANGTGGTTANGGSTNGTGTGTGSGTSTGSSLGPTSGQAFGGGVIGVEPPPTKQSILIYKKKEHYNEWEFTYSPLSELKSIMGSSGPNGLPGSGTAPGGTGFGGSSGGFGGSNTGGFGGSSAGFGGSNGPGFGGSSGSGFGGSNNGTGTNQAPAPQQNQQF